MKLLEESTDCSTYKFLFARAQLGHALRERLAHDAFVTDVGKIRRLPLQMRSAHWRTHRFEQMQGASLTPILLLDFGRPWKLDDGFATIDDVDATIPAFVGVSDDMALADLTTDHLLIPASRLRRILAFVLPTHVVMAHWNNRRELKRVWSLSQAIRGNHYSCTRNQNHETEARANDLSAASVSAAAYVATTVRLSAAMAVALCMPQMSWRPCAFPPSSP